MKKVLLQIILSLILPAVSMATVVTKAGSGSVCPGSEIAIPISVTGLDDVSAISLCLSYDDSKITFLGHANVNGNLSGTFMTNAFGGNVYISWYSTNSVNIGNDTLVWLRFEGMEGNTSLAWNAGNCEYADATGHPIASSFTNGSVNVYAAPTILSHPSNITVVEGNNASFQVSASGHGLTYQWQIKFPTERTWSNLANGSSYSNVNANRMTVSNVSMLMNGNQFRCVVIGTCLPPVVSNPASLNVTNFIPTIVTQAGTCSSCPDEEFVIPVTVTNCNNVGAISLALEYDRNAVTYIGYQNKHAALSDGLTEINANNGVVYMTWASSGPTLNIGNGLLVELLFESQPSNHVFLWNAGNSEYSDMSGNALPSSYTPGSVTVYYRPSINSNPVNRTIDEGSSTTFSISASGQGLTYQWQVSEDGGTTWSDCTNGTYYNNVSSSTLTVRDAPFSLDGNLYHCAVSGTCPSPVTSESAMLTIRKFIPTIVTSTGSVTTCENNNFSIPVSVTNCNNVGAVSLALNFNSTLVSFVGYENTHEQLDGGTVEVNAAEGVVYFTWVSSSQSLEIEDGKLVDLIFSSLSGNSSLSWKTNYCEYSDPLGNILPTSFAGSNLTIYHAPIITTNPSDKTIDEGTGTTFSVNASGQSLTFQWQCSEDDGATWFDLSNNSNYSNVTGTVLRVNDATVSMNGNLYRCMIGGYCAPEAVSNPAMLSVMGVLPTITTSIEATTSCPGVNFSVPVNVTNFNNVGAISLALSYDTTVLRFNGYSDLNETLCDGSLVVNASNGVVYASWASVNGANIGDGHLMSFDFIGVPGNSALNWKPDFCEYGNLDGLVFPCTFRNSFVSISEYLIIAEQPQNLLAYEGDNVTFSVRTNTTPSSYQWRISQDGGATWTNLTTDEHYSEVTSRILHVNNLDMSMNGNQYCCAVTDACHSLVVSERASLMVDGYYTAWVRAEPESYGSVSGGGVFPNGAMVTISASSYLGFSFESWTENGTVVSTSAIYNFVIDANRDLVANFVPNSYHWEVSHHQVEYDMSVIGIILIEGVEQRTSTLELGAFVNDECRGRQLLSYYPQEDRYLVSVALYGDIGDELEFRLYDHETETESTLTCLNTLPFQINGMVGTPMEPYVFSFVNRQNAEMAEGWNWFSTYIEQDGIDGLVMLETSLANNGVMVKAQDGGFVMNDVGFWLGNLNAICNEKTYLINTSAACEAQITGPNAVPAAHPVTVNTNWSWIGYPADHAIDLNEALSNFEQTDGDVIKSFDCFSTYFSGMGWFGSLQTLKPGMGLMYYSQNETSSTLIYASGIRETIKENLTATNNYWKPNAHAYPYNMSVMASVELDGLPVAGENFELAAFNGIECRGSVRLVYVAPTNSYFAFLPIAGDDRTEINFALYDDESGMIYRNSNEILHFESNAVVGSLKEPYAIHFFSSAQMDELNSYVRLFPNPVSKGDRFEIDLPNETELKVEIINTLGMTVLVESTIDQPASFIAPDVSGVYMVKVIAKDKCNCICKLVVK